MPPDQGKRALSYHRARIESGLDLRAYDHVNVPEGTWCATLDLKVWPPQLGQPRHCYFTAADGARYRLGARRGDADHPVYTAADKGIDMSSAAVQPGMRFRLTVGRARTGMPKWLGAERIEE